MYKSIEVINKVFKLINLNFNIVENIFVIMKLREVAIFTNDVPSTTSFYERLLGPPDVDEESLSIFEVDGVKVLIHEKDSEDNDHLSEEHQNLPSQDHYAFAVDDLDETFNTLSEDLIVYREPMNYEWGRSAYFMDPDGRIVEITEE